MPAGALGPPGSFALFLSMDEHDHNPAKEQHKDGLPHGIKGN